MAGGYEYNFVETPDELLCLVCHHIAKEAHQLECCGKMFCKTCINDDRISSCPDCREPSPRIFRDLRSSRDIKRLRVSCKNEERGCNWSDSLEEYEAHKVECGFEEVRCSNWFWCQQTVQRQHLKEHTDTECSGRKEECQVCHGEVIHAEMLTHPLRCPKVEVECTNCTVRIFREQLHAHRSICPKEKISCPYKNSGCATVILREDRQKHLQENIEQHSIIANDTVSALKGELLDVRKKLKDANNALESKRVPPLTFKMSSYAQLKENKGTWNSPCFFTHEGGYKMKMFVKTHHHEDVHYLTACVQIVFGPNDDQLVWPFAGSLKMEILNQYHNSGHHSRPVEWNGASEKPVRKPIKGEANTGRGPSKFISYADLEQERTTCVYLKDDCIYFRISNASAAVQCKPWLIYSP